MRNREASRMRHVGHRHFEGGTTAGRAPLAWIIDRFGDL